MVTYMMGDLRYIRTMLSRTTPWSLNLRWPNVEETCYDIPSRYTVRLWATI